MDTAPKLSTNQGLERALDLINHLASTCSSLSVMEISELLGITRLTAQTLVNTLLKQNYIEQSSVPGKYALGYKAYGVGSMYRYRYPFLATAQKFIPGFAQKLDVKVNVSVLKPVMVTVILLSHAYSTVPIPTYGQLVPANASASGKLLLAQMDEETLESWLAAAPLKKLTSYTADTPAELRKQLDIIRKAGYSQSINELSLGASCIAAPIRNASGKAIAAISFSLEPEKLEANFDVLRDNILILSRLISTELGYIDIPV